MVEFRKSFQKKVTRNCKMCGTEFSTVNRTAKCCSDRCSIENKKQAAKKWYAERSS